MIQSAEKVRTFPYLGWGVRGHFPSLKNSPPLSRPDLVNIAECFSSCYKVNQRLIPTDFAKYSTNLKDFLLKSWNPAVSFCNFSKISQINVAKSALGTRQTLTWSDMHIFLLRFSSSRQWSRRPPGPEFLLGVVRLDKTLRYSKPAPWWLHRSSRHNLCRISTGRFFMGSPVRLSVLK